MTLDLREEGSDRSVARLDGSMFFGCSFPDAEWSRLAASGAGSFITRHVPDAAGERRRTDRDLGR